MRAAKKGRNKAEKRGKEYGREGTEVKETKRHEEKRGDEKED